MFACLVGLWFGISLQYTANAQELSYDDLLATTTALQAENADLRALFDQETLEAECKVSLDMLKSLVAALSTPEPVETAVPTDAGDGTGAFTDDFSDQSAWELGEGGQIQNGELMVTTTIDRASVTVPFEIAAPFELSVDAKFPPDALLTKEASIMILYGDLENDDYVAVRIQPEHIDVLQNDNREFLQELSLPDPMPDWATYHKITISFSDTLSVYIDGQLLGTSPYTQSENQIALGVDYFGVSRSAAVLFDNLRIQPLHP
jgi:hypothetical protein